MKLKVFNKLGTGYFFIEVKSTRDIEVVAEEGFKFEYVSYWGSNANTLLTNTAVNNSYYKQSKSNSSYS